VLLAQLVGTRPKLPIGHRNTLARAAPPPFAPEA
jgi:hypothetical protein